MASVRQISPSSSASSTVSSVLTASPTLISASPTSTRSFITPPPPPPPHLRSLKKPLYRPAVLRYGTSLKVNGEDWSQQLFWGQIPAVSGPPRRSHWVSDDSALSCQSCHKAFTFWERRHHCRRCGQIYCAAHSSHLLRLDQNCNFHPKGILSRTCDNCAHDFNRTVIEAMSQYNANAEISDSADAINNINRITNMVTNSNGARLPFDSDLSDDELMSPNSPAALRPMTSATSSSYFFGASSGTSGIATSEILEGRTPALSDGHTQLSREIQLHLQQQLGGGGLAIPITPNKNHPMNQNTPSERNGSYVPSDWNWSTF
ncbi:hypothetical protein V1512DRAFT_262320 [Lipomyces arxii]|uniref:uncharacterized protein n=1 Tax=Lipomyces arxii TaxID=56418 RepID=UPI0034CFE418